MKNPFEVYLTKIEADLRGGKATEYTYRSTLETLIESLASGVDASNDPKHIACGAPDFIVERGSVPLGYVETKDVGVPLDKIEKSEQLKRYRQSLNNLILTDYLEFRWYVSGQHKLTARLATADKKGKLTPDPEGLALAEKLFAAFYQTEVPTVGTPHDLAERMAHIAQFIRELLVKSLTTDIDSEHDALDRQYLAFREHLLPTLKAEEFADIYAQTMAYGLFAAKLSAPENVVFSRAVAYQYLAANRFLRKLFLDVGEELDGTLIAPHLDDLAALLAHADIAAILKDFGKRTRTEDPVVHFYETFLATYDPKLRKSRGVYYTPEPAVQFIVSSIDWLLKTRFNRSMGLADPDVNLLDPATGTSTFLYFVIRSIYETLSTSGQGGVWQEYVHKDLLPRLFGFELLIAPYVIAHLKLSLLLRDLGYQFVKNDRLKVFLTNTLDEGITHAETLGDLGSYITQEANDAAQVKKHTPIMVVLGNPPYSGHSANASKTNTGEMTFIGKLVRDYYFVDGAPLGERNPKWLQDDYVKFIRFAQWRIQQTGHGIVAFITNHGYLDNPTFRGMRQHLLKTFDEIFVLDLHGNSKKKERAPDGGKDENIFDIQQGVAILLAVKTPSRPAATLPHRAADAQTQKEAVGAMGEGRGGGLATIHHAHLYGERSGKYRFLERNSAGSIQWTQLQPTKPSYLFIPQNNDLRGEYEQGWNITEAFPINNIAMQTHRDYFVTDLDTQELRNRITAFRETRMTNEEARSKFDLGSWDVAKARKKLRSDENWQKGFTQCLWRPFDIRPLYYHRELIDRPRPQVTEALLEPNFGLLAMRQIALQGGCSHFLVANIPPVDRVFYSNKGAASVFPLYLYTTPDDTAGTLFAQTETTRTPNLAPEFIKAFSGKLGLAFVPDGQGDLKKTFGPEDIFNYAYAIFHSPTYRQRYAEFLKIDFPRLPLTSDKKLFAKLAAKGAELVSLHLLKTSTLNSFITTFPISGSNSVDKVRYDASRKKVWINDEQYFGGLPEKVWEFQVGGYQVCEKWLKDRKGRTLSTDDIRHYQRVVVALKETIRLMAEIDKVIPGWPIL